MDSGSDLFLPEYPDKPQLLDTLAQVIEGLALIRIRPVRESPHKPLGSVTLGPGFFLPGMIVASN
jgi:hypothetical protein